MCQFTCFDLMHRVSTILRTCSKTSSSERASLFKVLITTLHFVFIRSFSVKRVGIPVLASVISSFGHLQKLNPSLLVTQTMIPRILFAMHVSLYLLIPQTWLLNDQENLSPSLLDQSMHHLGLPPLFGTRLSKMHQKRLQQPHSITPQDQNPKAFNQNLSPFPSWKWKGNSLIPHASRTRRFIRFRIFVFGNSRIYSRVVDAWIATREPNKSINMTLQIFNPFLCLQKWLMGVSDKKLFNAIPKVCDCVILNKLDEVKPEINNSSKSQTSHDSFANSLLDPCPMWHL